MVMKHSDTMCKLADGLLTGTEFRQVIESRLDRSHDKQELLKTERSYLCVLVLTRTAENAVVCMPGR